MLGSLAIIYPLWKLLGYRNMRSTILVTDAYTEFQEFERKLARAQTSKELQKLIEELNQLEDHCTEDWIVSVEMKTVFAMKGELDKIRSKATDKKQTSNLPPRNIGASPLAADFAWNLSKGMGLQAKQDEHLQA